MKKRIISICLILCMLGSLLPVSVQAAGNPYGRTQTIEGVEMIRCTWYAWQQVYERQGIELPSWGDAGDWYAAATASGFATGSEAMVGAVACWSRSNSPCYGHVAYVTQINNNGTFDIVEGGSQWNGNVNGVLARTIDSRYWPDQGFIYIGAAPAYNSPTVYVTVNGSTVDVAWNDVGAASYYLYVQNQDTQNIPYGENLGKSLSCHLELASGNYKVYVSAVYTESNILTGSAAFSILLERSAPTVSTVVNGKTVDISWNDVGAVSYELHVFSLDSGDVAFSQDMGRTFSHRLELSAGQWQVNVTALYEGFDNGLAGSCVCTVTSGGAGPTVIASGACGDNLTWTLDEQGALTISGTGPMWDWNRGNEALWYEYRASIKTAVIQSGVTNIGKFAFEGCNSLVSVTIPDGITSIGAFAFEYCGLTDVTLPGSATTIGNYAFYGCDNLTSLTVPECVTDIGNYAFSWCTNLATVLLPSSVTNIGDYAFSYCYYLASITMPEGVTSMGDSVFEGCGTLTSVTIPLGITSIGKNAFHYCTSLASVALPVSVVSVDNGAFSFCDKLADVYYGGTQEQWDGIAIAINNEPLLNATLHVQPGGDPTPTVIASGTCGANLTWILDNAGTLTISGTGEMWDYVFEAPSPWPRYNNTIKSAVILDGVTSIGNGAFTCCSSLTSVTIPSSVTCIGGGTFSGCSSLTDITIPSSMTSIGEGAFSGCSSLQRINVAENNPNYCSIDGVLYSADRKALLCVPGGRTGAFVIPASVTSIGDDAFNWCSSLTDITIPSSVTSIGDDAFYLCSSLTDITIPSSVTSIGSGAFSGCSGLTSVTIPSSMTSIGDYAFSGCSSLTSVTIPSGVTIIGNSAFLGCGSLTSVTIPSSVTSIGEWAFASCGGLTSAKIPSSVTSIGEGAFSGCSSLTSVTIPSGVTIIGNSAFLGCGSLTSVTIPPSVTSIGNYAFSWCSSLTSVTIPSSVTSIGEGVFASCGGLTNVRIPESVTSIDSNAFYNCDALTDVYYSGTQEQWDAITIGRYNDPLLNATLHVHPGGDSPAIALTARCLYDRIVPSEPSIHNEPICEDGTVVFSYVGDVGMDVPPEIDGYQYRYKTVGNAHGAHLEARLTDAGETAYYIVEYNGQATPVTGDTVVTYHYYIPNPQPSLPVAYYHDEDGNELLPPQTLTLDENGQVWFTEMVGDYEAFRLLAPEIDGYTIKAVHVRGEYGGSGSALPTLGCFLGPWDDYDGQWLLGQQGTESGSVSGTPMCTYVYERNTAGSVEEPGVIASGFCGAQGDNLVWTLSEDGTLTISGTGAMADYYTQQDQHFAQGDYEYGQTAPVEELYADNPPWYFSERFITGIVIEDGVTSVGRHAFQCTAFQRLNSVTIPASMTSIGDFAFCVCYNLADVYYAGAQGQWDAITVGEHNEPLLSATLHLESTGPMIIASGNCGAQGDNVTWTLDEAGTLTISGTGDMADFLDSWDPWYNKGVKAAVIKSGVTSIGGGAFAYCSSLTSVTIPNTVTSIGLDAFSNCSSLTSVTIPESVTSIGSSAFIFSSKLGAIHVAETNPSYRSLDGVLYTADGKKLCSVPGAKMGVFVIPDTVTSIGERAFQTCGSLTRITIPDTVTSIGDWAFGYCTALTSLTIPANVTSIGYATFANCRGLTSVTIPESMTSIGDAAFFNCDSLADVYYGGTQAQWDAVTVGEFNEPLENATLHLESTGPGFVEAETVTYVWGEDGNATVYDEQGNLLTNTWIRMEIPLQGPDGGEFIDIIWRYTDENGRFVEGWQEIDGYTYYFLGSITYRSLRDQACGIDRAFYFFDEEGRMRRDGWAQSSGSEKVYYAGADGKLLQGWQTIDGKQYYFSAAEGYAPYRWQNGVYTIDGEDYRFAEDGSLIGKVQNDQPGFRIGSVVGHAGKTVTVSVSLENNPGIALFKVYVEYDESVLEWTGIEHIALDGFWSAEVNKPIVWMGDGETEYDGNGEIFTLTFTVKDDAQPCETAVSLRYDPDDIQTWNESIFNYDNVAFAVLDGTVTVRSTVTVTGTVTGWNGSADAEVYLYAADTEDTVLNAAAQSGDYSGAIVSATLSGVTVYGKRYICAFTLADVEPGTYKLLVMKPGKYVPVIRTVTLEDDADLGKVKLWLYGDVTDDGKVNGTDALQIKRYFADISSIFMVGTEEEQAARLLAANVTAILSGDNKVNGTDALQIQRYFADISSVFEYMR